MTRKNMVGSIRYRLVAYALGLYLWAANDYQPIMLTPLLFTFIYLIEAHGLDNLSLAVAVNKNSEKRDEGHALELKRLSEELSDLQQELNAIRRNTCT